MQTILGQTHFQTTLFQEQLAMVPKGPTTVQETLFITYRLMFTNGLHTVQITQMATIPKKVVPYKVTIHSRLRECTERRRPLPEETLATTPASTSPW